MGMIEYNGKKVKTPFTFNGKTVNSFMHNGKRVTMNGKKTISKTFSFHYKSNDNVDIEEWKKIARGLQAGDFVHIVFEYGHDRRKQSGDFKLTSSPSISGNNITIRLVDRNKNSRFVTWYSFSNDQINIKQNNNFRDKTESDALYVIEHYKNNSRHHDYVWIDSIRVNNIFVDI